MKTHVLPKFGKRAVNEINRQIIKTFLMKKINEGYAPSTVTHFKNVISGVLNHAVDDEMIPFNPAQKIGKIFKHQKMGNRMNPFTNEELKLLLDVFKEHFPEHYPLALTLSRTGMRFGEAVALKWNDIDFERRFIFIERGIVRGVIETPKNGKPRKVDMSLQLSNVLSGLKTERKIQTLKNGWKNVPEWVFISQVGTYLSKSNWRRRIFYKALEKAGLRKRRIHDVRHSYASLLIQSGESLAYIRDQLGHHSIKVTVDIYGHLAPEGNKAAVDSLDDDNWQMQPDATYMQPNKKRN